MLVRYFNIILILVLLVIPFLVVMALGESTVLGGRIGITCVFLFTGVGHFLKGKAMSAMLPLRTPERFRMPIIYLSGVFELATAVAILVPGCTKVVGILLCGFLVLVLPSNIDSAIRRVPFGGHDAGPVYLFARVPLQIVLVGWVYWFAIAHGK